MCDCISKIREALSKDEKYSNAQIDIVRSIKIKSNEIVERAGKLNFSYQVKKKDGTLSNKKEYSFFSFSHCPFCGKKY